MVWTEPTLRARSMLCTRVELVGDLPQLLRVHGRPDRRQLGAQPRTPRPASPPAVASAIAACRSATRGSAAVRLLTSAANTTAAAGAPPITEA